MNGRKQKVGSRIVCWYEGVVLLGSVDGVAWRWHVVDIIVYTKVDILFVKIPYVPVVTGQLAY